MNSPIFISEDQVLQLLTWPAVNDAVEQAMKATTQSQRNNEDKETPFAIQPDRTIITASKESQLLLTMPCFVGNYDLSPIINSDQTTPTDKIITGSTKTSTLSCKLVTSFPGNRERNPPLPNIMAHIMLFNVETGELMCVMVGTNITAWRTTAASIVATKYLFLKNAPTLKANQHQGLKLAIIGCGVQGRTHAFGMSHSFQIDEIYLWNRTMSKAEKLAEDLKRDLCEKPNRTVKVFVSGSPSEAVKNADIICVCTFSAEALVTMEMIKKANVHINAIGAGQVHFGEVSSDIYANALIYIDSWAGARKELKDLPGKIIGEVGEVILNGSYPSGDSITIFQSLGMASEDAAVGQAVFEAFKRHS